MTEPNVESLPDDQLLTLCDATLALDRQQKLSELLDRQHEGQLAPAEGGRLEELLAKYRGGLVLKALAWKEAVARGLRPPLDGDAG